MGLISICRDTASGYKLPFACIISSVSSSESLPTDATISMLYNDYGTSNWDHVHISKDDSIITVTVNNGTGIIYSGTVGSTYADLIKNVLTDAYGEYASGWAEVHCCDQLVDVDVFVEGSGSSCRLLEEIVIPPYTYSENLSHTVGTLYTNFDRRQTDGNDGVTVAGSESSSVRDGQSGFYGKDWGAGNEKAIYSATTYAATNYGYVYGGGTPVTLELKGSHDGTNWVTLATISFADASGSNPKTLVSSDQTTKYRYVAVFGSGAEGTTGVYFAEVVWVESVSAAYAPNGAYIDFALSGELGNDVSGNDNDWVISGTQATNIPI